MMLTAGPSPPPPSPQTSWGTANTLPFTDTGSETLMGVRLWLLVARWANAEAASEPRQSVLESKRRIPSSYCLSSAG